MSFFYSRRHEFATSDARPSTPTTKVDFLTIKVVLAITRTITVFRNAAPAWLLVTLLTQRVHPFAVKSP